MIYDDLWYDSKTWLKKPVATGDKKGDKKATTALYLLVAKSDMSLFGGSVPLLLDPFFESLFSLIAEYDLEIKIGYSINFKIGYQMWFRKYDYN